MYKMLLGTVALAGSLALAQQPTQQPTQSNPKGGAASDRSTARTMGEQNRTMTQASDKKFATEAAVGGMAEVQLGQLAAEKATNPEVKAFGQRMVTDHTKANDNLKAVASKQGITLPTSLDAKHQAVVDKLSKLSGAEFDRAYVREMVKDHDTDVKEFQKEAQNGSDQGIRDFASQTLPTLQDHQKSIHQIQQSMSSTTNSSDRSK